MEDYRVIDGSGSYTKSYIGTVFFRTDHVKEQVSVLKWIWLTLIEIITGAEIIESFVTTGSVPPPKNIKKEDSSKYGDELHLNSHIPSGFVTNLLRKNILEVLYYKFHWQYLILNQVGDTYISDKNKTIDCTRTRFRAQKNLFYQFIALRRVYDISWLIFNVSIDVIVYYLSSSIEWAVLSAVSIEAFRRLLRV